MSETKLIQFNCPTALLAEFDEAIKGRYGDRTEALLDLMRKLVDQYLARQARALQTKEASNV